MRIINYLAAGLLFFNSGFLGATEFTISSYNCGGLSDHYDYLRAAAMQKLMQERHIAEPENMALNEKIQQLALKILFSPDSKDKDAAQQEWEQKGYQQLFEHLTSTPSSNGSPNAVWNKKSEEMITSYKVRPVIISDEEVNQMLGEHLNDLSGTQKGAISELLQGARQTMAKRIFSHHLSHDIICLQEANYLDASIFPPTYEVLLGAGDHLENGVAWNTERFELVQNVGDILGKAYAVLLQDKQSGKRILVASGHITGCNPYRVEKDAITGAADSAKGDAEMQTVVDLFDNLDADLKLIGMDSNVTSLHPRLNILKDASYQLDYENYLEPTCANPYQVLNTRIDWIAIKPASDMAATITNIPVLSVGLNNLQTNISDHKPIAAKIKY